MNANDTAVETHGLTKIYGSGNTEVVAMRDVTFSVRHGEVMALLGPSGAGKSTLLTAVGLINPPTSGKVIINGQLVMDNSRAMTDLTSFRRNHIGFVFQKSNLIPFLSAIENVQVALEINQWSASKARQRVAVARALANRPSLILADEPTAALDSQRGRQVMELFRKVAREQKGAVIVVTHDHRALDIFDSIYDMEDGIIKRRERAMS
jgi:putative ABC transport system ATP-binding protein